MSKTRLAGMGDQDKFDAKTFDPWKTAAKKGEKISFIDVWLAQNPDSRSPDEMADAEREAAHLEKIASETGSNLYQGFERELEEIQSHPFDEILKDQKDIELVEDTFSTAPKASKPTFFPDF